MNPIKQFRTERGMTQQELAEKAGMSAQAVLRYEQGLYEHLSAKLAQAILGEQSWDIDTEGKLYADYAIFRMETQRAAHKYLYPRVVLIIDEKKHPFKIFRETITLRAVGRESQVAFCILLAIHPAVVADYSNGKMRTMPAMIKDALTIAGIDDDYLKSLEMFGETWYDRVIT